MLAKLRARFGPRTESASAHPAPALEAVAHYSCATCGALNVVPVDANRTDAARVLHPEPELTPSAGAS